MPSWLTLFLSLLATGGFFASLYFLVLFLVEGSKLKGGPRFGVVAGDGPNTIRVWVNWNASQFALQVYRLRFTHFSPFHEIKEGTFTVSFDSPMSEPFMQLVELPENFRWLLGREDTNRNLFQVEFKTVEELTLAKAYRIGKLKNIMRNQGASLPKIAKQLPLAKEDHATILSLDFSEIQARKIRMQELEAAAKAKAAKAAAAKAAPTAAPAPAVAAAPAPVAPVVAPPVAAKPIEVPSDKVVPAPAVAEAPKSVRDVVSAQNAKKTE